VKLQHLGQRRTFSLKATTRSAAAAEARRLDADLRSRGWEAVWPSREGARHQSSSPHSEGYWDERLVAEPAGPKTKPAAEFSVWIPFAETAHCFRLQTVDRQVAAARALSIYRVVSKRGWQAAFHLAPREVTLGMHWNANPFLCTYTTVVTMPEGGPIGESPIKPAQKRDQPIVYVVEPELALSRTLGHCLSHSYRVEPIAGDPPHRPDAAGICLLNRDVSEACHLASADGLSAFANGLPVIPYSVYSSSEELFRLAPGKLLGYCFKRLSREDLLAPVAACLSTPLVQTSELQRASRGFFQSWVQAPQPAQRPDEMASLTGRERDVLVLLSRGLVDKEIASALGISGWTVHEHVKRVFEKLQVHSRVEAALAYLRK